MNEAIGIGLKIVILSECNNLLGLKQVLLKFC